MVDPRRFMLDPEQVIAEMELPETVLPSSADTARAAMLYSYRASKRAQAKAGSHINHDHEWFEVDAGVESHDGEPITWRECAHCGAKRFKRGMAPLPQH